MKLLRYGPKGAEKPGLLDDGGAIRDLSGIVSDISGEALGDETLARLRALDPASLPTVEGPPVSVLASAKSASSFASV